jgi:hypothetical protein
MTQRYQDLGPWASVEGRSRVAPTPCGCKRRHQSCLPQVGSALRRAQSYWHDRLCLAASHHSPYRSIHDALPVLVLVGADAEGNRLAGALGSGANTSMDSIISRSETVGGSRSDIRVSRRLDLGGVREARVPAGSTHHCSCCASHWTWLLVGSGKIEAWRLQARRIDLGK